MTSKSGRDTRPDRILFVCTGNSCRSQMAEALLAELSGGRFETYSAGTAPAERVHPWAVRAMREIGIDISDRETKSISDLPVSFFDTVVTVCDNARGECVRFPGARRRIHWSIPDPAAAGGTQHEIESEFRRVRDMIRERLLAEFGLSIAQARERLGLTESSAGPDEGEK